MTCENIKIVSKKPEPSEKIHWLSASRTLNAFKCQLMFVRLEVGWGLAVT